MKSVSGQSDETNNRARIRPVTSSGAGNRADDAAATGRDGALPRAVKIDAAQLEAVPHAQNNVAVRRTLLTVPTVLAYTACVTSHFDPLTCFINVVLWSIAMLAKLPFMNGVRLFGINRTAGIDDCVPRSKKQS